MRGQIGAQEREIGMLRRAGASTVSAEALLARMRAKVDGLCKERASLRRLSKASVVGGDDFLLRNGRAIAVATDWHRGVAAPTRPVSAAAVKTSA